MRQIDIGWGFGDIFSKDRICFSGYGITVIKILDTNIYISDREIDNIIFQKINELLKVQIPKYTSEQLIEQGDVLITILIDSLRNDIKKQNLPFILDDIRDWKFEPPEEVKQMYSKMKLRDVAHVDIDKLYQLQTVKEIAKETKGPLSIDLSQQTTVTGTYVAGDMKTIHGDEISGNAQKINISDSVINRSNIGGAKPNKCPSCQTDIQSNWKACPTCGNRL